jgi:hypothetical protein
MMKKPIETADADSFKQECQSPDEGKMHEPLED